MPLKLVTINVRGLSSSKKADVILHELERLPYDLFLLQETHVSCKERADGIAKKWRGNCFWSFGVGRSAGVAIFVSPRFAGTVSRFLFDTDGRVLSVLVQLGNTTLNIVNVYAPNTVSERKIFLENLHLYFLSSSRVIAGDFNCVDNALDRLVVTFLRTRVFKLFCLICHWLMFGGKITLVAFLTLGLIVLKLLGWIVFLFLVIYLSLFP